jgi:hypothetical protein
MAKQFLTLGLSGRRRRQQAGDENRESGVAAQVYPKNGDWLRVLAVPVPFFPIRSKPHSGNYGMQPTSLVEVALSGNTPDLVGCATVDRVPRQV